MATKKNNPKNQNQVKKKSKKKSELQHATTRNGTETKHFFEYAIY